MTVAAAIVAAAGLLPVTAVLQAIGSGQDVYLFLIGMMLLAEIARREGVFDWLAGVAVRACGGSRQHLFGLVYAVGIRVTVVLSNDATAVVLTPAVAAAVRAAKVEPLPYLFACAFVANAASFVLPISNPANLVVYERGMPPLLPWLVAFALPSLCSIAATYLVLRLLFRKALVGSVRGDIPRPELGTSGSVALLGIGATAIALVAASAFGANLGAVTLTCSVVMLVAVVAVDRRAMGPVLSSVSWTVVFLVAGLFVLVAAAEQTGLLTATEAALHALARLPTPISVAAAALGTGIASNAVNNLPAGLIAGSTLSAEHAARTLRSSVAIGIDLGPNLSVTGSLATILWLLALRREKIEIHAAHFLRVGALAMPAALLAAVGSLLVTAR